MEPILLFWLFFIPGVFIGSLLAKRRYIRPDWSLDDEWRWWVQLLLRR